MKLGSNGFPLYHKLFFIALYDQSDYLVDTADNVRELLEIIGAEPTNNNLLQMRRKLFNSIHKKKKFHWKGKFVQAYMIEDIPETE